VARVDLRDAPEATVNELENLRAYLATLDERHLRYAEEYADELSLGEPAPSSAGLERLVVREIRRRVWLEWRRRIEAMGSGRR
jgi:hypothetical protein